MSVGPRNFSPDKAIMTDSLVSILGFIVYLPLYLTAFVGIGLVLKLRRTHPRACWFTVTAAALMFLNWGLLAAFRFNFDRVLNLTRELGPSIEIAVLLLNCISSALCTIATLFLLAAILTGRRSEP